MQNANQTMLQRILIAMLNEIETDCEWDLEDMYRGICRTSVYMVDFIRPLGIEVSQLQI